MLKRLLLLTTLGLCLVGLSSQAYGVQVGVNIDVHQDIHCVQGQNCPNDFHVEGIICSNGGWPFLIDHVDDIFSPPNGSFSYSITYLGVPDPCYYKFVADWTLNPPMSMPGIPFCQVLHLGLLFDANAANLMLDLKAWWTRDGQRIGEIIPLRNGGFVPSLGFAVDDDGGAAGQTIRIANGSIIQPGTGEPGIPVQLIGMDVVPFPPGEVPPFRELRVGGSQQFFPWAKVMNGNGLPIGPGNPLPMMPDSFFDVFLEIPQLGKPFPERPITIEPGGFLVARTLVQFVNNSNEVEERWGWEVHGAPPLQQEHEFGDAPEGALAYPATGIIGSFPTCMNVGPAGFIQHTNFGAWLGPAFDFEMDGNAGLCPMFAPYDADECFADGDAGLLIPTSYTIQGGMVVPCPLGPAGQSLGVTCQQAVWGANIDVQVRNTMPNQTKGFLNVLIDWDQSGSWGGASPCPNGPAPEHVLVDFPIPNGFIGPVSALGPPPFVIGPNSGEVWMRVTITERPVMKPWDGSGSFEDGETEDYLIKVDPEIEEWQDLGDAPDSSNNYGLIMTAYPMGGPAGVVANFPTVYQTGSPPFGPIHWQPWAIAYLGQAVTGEREADIGLDQDPTNNILPPNDVPDRDGADDGLIQPLIFPNCYPSTFNYVVTVTNPVAQQLFFNAWCDWNRDGDWNDTMMCQPQRPAPEWAVQNQPVFLPGPGTFVMTTPTFLPWHPLPGPDALPMWMRLTLSEQPWPPAGGTIAAGGEGPANGYQFGETEDYYVTPEVPIPVDIVPNGWRSLKTHGQAADPGNPPRPLYITLNPASTVGDVETRSGGLTRVHIIFDDTLVSSGLTQNYFPGNVLVTPALGVTESLTTTTKPNDTLVLTLTGSVDLTCYKIDLTNSVLWNPAAMNKSCLVRVQFGNVTGDAFTNLTDAAQVKARNSGVPITQGPNVPYDVSLDGYINLTDVAQVKAKNSASTTTLCPP